MSSSLLFDSSSIDHVPETTKRSISTSLTVAKSHSKRQVFEKKNSPSVRNECGRLAGNFDTDGPLVSSTRTGPRGNLQIFGREGRQLWYGQRLQQRGVSRAPGHAGTGPDVLMHVLSVFVLTWIPCKALSQQLQEWWRPSTRQSPSGPSKGNLALA